MPDGTRTWWPDGLTIWPDAPGTGIDGRPGCLAKDQKWGLNHEQTAGNLANYEAPPASLPIQNYSTKPACFQYLLINILLTNLDHKSS